MAKANRTTKSGATAGLCAVCGEGPVFSGGALFWRCFFLVRFESRVLEKLIGGQFGVRQCKGENRCGAIGLQKRRTT